MGKSEIIYQFTVKFFAYEDTLVYNSDHIRSSSSHLFRTPRLYKHSVMMISIRTSQSHGRVANCFTSLCFQGKLMSVKLSTSRLRTVPGMGERTGCYRCGQEGHWSKECPLDQNGSYREGAMGPDESNGFGPPRFGGRGRGFHRGFNGADPGFGGSFAPSHGISRGGAYGGEGPGYGRGATGYESAMGYGVPPGYGMAADPSLAHAHM